MLARSRLAGLGFTVGTDARHPFGTGNCCVFFENRTYLEPITIVDRAGADRAAAEGVLFVKRIKRFTERIGEGFAMLAMKSADAQADRKAFEADGMAAGPVHSLRRMAKGADGAEREIGFEVAHMEAPEAPDASFFACQHLDADLLFQPALMQHANGATGVAAVTAVAQRPGDFAKVLKGAVGAAELDESEAGIDAAGEGQSLAVVTPAAFRDRYGLDAPDPRKGLRLAAFDIAVSDIGRALGFAGPTAKRHGDRIVIPPSPGLGAVLAFGSVADG